MCTLLYFFGLPSEPMAAFLFAHGFSLFPAPRCFSSPVGVTFLFFFGRGIVHRLVRHRLFASICSCGGVFSSPTDWVPCFDFKLVGELSNMDVKHECLRKWRSSNE